MSAATATAETATLRRVQDGLFHVRKGLAPFVEARMRKARGADWLRYASRASGSGAGDALDAYGLLKTMIENWRDAFEDAFRAQEKQKARNFASMALEARNATAHLTLPLADNEALRYLDVMHQLLRLAKAPDAEVAELRRLYEEQRRSGISPAPPQATPGPAPPPRLDLTAQEMPAKALKPWPEVALPHPDLMPVRSTSGCCCLN